MNVQAIVLILVLLLSLLPSGCTSGQAQGTATALRNSANAADINGDGRVTSAELKNAAQSPDWIFNLVQGLLYAAAGGVTTVALARGKAAQQAANDAQDTADAAHDKIAAVHIAMGTAAPPSSK